METKAQLLYRKIQIDSNLDVVIFFFQELLEINVKIKSRMSSINVQDIARSSDLFSEVYLTISKQWRYYPQKLVGER